MFPLKRLLFAIILIYGMSRGFTVHAATAQYDTSDMEADVFGVLPLRHPVLGRYPVGCDGHHGTDGHLPHPEDSPYQSGHDYQERIITNNENKQ